MFELTVTIAISASSFFLFCYWFRYTCQLILSAATAQDYSTGVAQAHQLCFQEARQGLSDGTLALDRLKDMLDRDYAVVSRLMNQIDGGSSGMERHMMATLYRLTSVRYQVGHRISTAAARQALEEMARVVAYLANSIGECAATSAAA
jgi:hypothetical protein